MNELGQKIAAKLVEKKGKNVVIADVTNLTPLTSCYVVCSATSNRQLNGLADIVYEVLKDEKAKLNHVEGKNGSRWIVVDCYDVVVHLFDMKERERIAFDKIIEKCPHTLLSDDEDEDMDEPLFEEDHLDSRLGD